MSLKQPVPWKFFLLPGVLACILLIFPSVMAAQVNEVLYLRISEEDESYGYVSASGDIVIPYGKYPMCFTDTLKHFAFVYKEGAGIVGIDRDENVLFRVYEVDNGPDYVSEGLFRIVDRDKVGFADMTGSVVVPAHYDDALPFSGGLAGVCFGCTAVEEGEYTRRIDGLWGFIDKGNHLIIESVYSSIISGFMDNRAEVVFEGKNIVIDETGQEAAMVKIDYSAWIELLGLSMKLLSESLFDNRLLIEAGPYDKSNYWIFSRDEEPPVEISIYLRDERKLLDQYILIPWQSFLQKNSLRPDTPFIIQPELYAVTDYAVLFKPLLVTDEDDNVQGITDTFRDQFNILVDYQHCNSTDEDFDPNLPENIRIISATAYRYYFDVQVALPGSVLPAPDELGRLFHNKMMRMTVIPDRGPTQTRWIKPDSDINDTYYRSAEQQLHDIFRSTLTQVRTEPEKRDDVYLRAKAKMRHVFNAANSYVNLLHEKYSERLRKWLLVGTEGTETTTPEIIFQDYQPKTSPDTAVDYMPLLGSIFDKLPAARIDKLTALLNLFVEYRIAAEEHPGSWEDGNMALGARGPEYRPSKEELVVAEIGDRIQTIVADEPEVSVQERIRMSLLDDTTLDYRRFSFIHLDVMGSGRFFYVENIEDIQITFK